MDKETKQSLYGHGTIKDIIGAIFFILWFGFLFFLVIGHILNL